MVDELLKQWREHYDDMAEDTAELNAQIASLKESLDEIATPYRERMGELEDEIKMAGLARGMSHSAEGVMVSYRKGYERVSYDSKQVDAVVGVMRDVLPEAARTLDGARKVNRVSPSVSVKAV